MLDWIVDQLIAIVTFVPALFVAQDSPHFQLVRGMFGLLLILLIILTVALRAEIASLLTTLFRKS